MPGTDTDPNDTLPNDLEDILNAQPEIINAGGVKVTGVSSTGYTITFNNNGDQMPFTGEESFPLNSVELVPGSLVLPVTEDVVGDDNPPTREVQSFAIEPTEFFTLSFHTDPFAAYDTTPPIAPTATAMDVQDALNLLPSIISAGGVTVQKDTFNNRFVVLFTTPFDVELLLANSARKEIQRLDFYAIGEFELSFGGFTTTPRLAFDATPQQVQDALNALPSIPPGGVTVAGAPNGAYDVTFVALGDEFPISSTQYSAINITTTDGTAGTPEIVKVLVPERIIYNPAAIPTANFIGGIADPLSLTGPKPFRFINLNGTPGFDAGDQPIDGLVVAKKMIQATMNATPEARLIDGIFYDYNNLL